MQGWLRVEHMAILEAACRALMARASGRAFGQIWLGELWLGSVNKFTESSRRAWLTALAWLWEAATSCGGWRDSVVTASLGYLFPFGRRGRILRLVWAGEIMKKRMPGWWSIRVRIRYVVFSALPRRPAWPRPAGPAARPGGRADRLPLRPGRPHRISWRR